MAKLTLQITGETKDVNSKIKAIKTSLEEIEKHPIKIGVSASGLDAIADKLKAITAEEIKAAEAAAKKANAEAHKINAETRAAESARKLAKYQKEQTQTTQEATKATQQATKASDDLNKRIIESAKQALNAKQESLQLSDAYLQIAQSAINASTGSNALAQATVSVSRYAGIAEARVRSLTTAYKEFSLAIRSGNGEIDDYYIPQRNALPGYDGGTATSGSASGVGPYADAIDVEWRVVEEGANAAAGAVNNAASAAGRAQSAFSAMREGMGAAWAKMQEGTPIADALGDSVGNIIVKITTWQVVNGIVASIKRAFSDALDTMKEVDTQLTTIQKVTDRTDQSMKSLADSAYRVASAYGVSATDYLESVATFARAGYGDTAEAAAELAIKTQLVGDMTADVANKFLVAVDAAYNYEHNIESLNSVLDKANKIENTQAVSLTQLAEAMPKVASMASMAKVSIDELLAGVGTIIATTQTTASTAGTALRSIIANVLNSTEIEVEEGVTQTEEQIKSFTDVLNKYATESMRAAAKAGELINPMEALNALAKAFKENAISEADMYAIEYSLAGKLRINQLSALLSEWDSTYEQIMTDIQDAAGSADKELQVMSGSWERKLNVLQNTWTEFISHIVDSDAIKTGIDFLTNVIGLLDSGIGEIAAITAGILAAGKAVAILINAVKGGAIYEAIQMVVLGAGTATEVFGLLTSAMLANPLFWGVAAATLIYAFVKAYDALNVSVEEHLDKMQDANKEYQDATSEIERINKKLDENKSLLEKVNAAEDDGGAYAQRLQIENDKLNEQLVIQRERQRLALQEKAQEAEAALTSKSYSISMGGVGMYGMSIVEYANAMQSTAGTNANTQKAFDDLVDKIVAARDALIEYQKAGGFLTVSQKEALSEADEFISQYVGTIQAAVETTDDLSGSFDAAATKAKETFISLAASLSEHALPAFKALSSAYKDVAEDGNVSLSTVTSLGEAFGEIDGFEKYIDRLMNVRGSGEKANEVLTDMAYALLSNEEYARSLAEADTDLVAAMLNETGVVNADKVAIELVTTAKEILSEKTNTAKQDVISFIDTLVDETTYSDLARKALIRLAAQMATAKDTKLDFSAQITELKRLAIAAGVAQAVVSSIGRPDIVKPSQTGKGLATDFGTGGGSSVDKLLRLINDATTTDFNYDGDTGSGGGSGSGRGGGGGGGSSTTENPAVTAAKAELQARKDTVALLKSELTLMQERGDATADIVAKMREIQVAEHDQADYMRSVTDLWDELGIDQGDINALSTDWWKIYKQIVELTEEKVDLDENELDNISAKIALEKQNLSFLESSGASTEQQIAQIKVIQAQLHIEAEIRRQNLETLKETATTEAEIAAAEKEIVALSTEWWSYQQKIVKLEEEQAKQAEEARKKAIEDAKKQALELLEAEEEAAKGPLQEQLDILEAQRDALKSQNDEQEKLLAVEKARIALQNAQNERKIRVYNASTGDWEWMADASTVSGAQDALNKAEQALADYYANQQIEALKTQINAIAEAYKTLRSAIEEFASAILDGTMGYRAAVASLMGAVSGTGLESTAARAAGLFSGIGNGAGSSRGGSATGAGRGAAPGYGLDTTNDYSLLMANAQTLDEFNHWANLRTQKIAAMGYDINALGWDSNEDIWKRWAAQHGYDRGGILRGMGGIKATYADEMVLPPEATAGLLNAERSGAFDALLAHLGIVTSAANNYAGFNGAVASRTSIGSQYNGPMYQFGDICMTEDQARSTTVYDLAQMARALALHNN